MRRIKTKDEVIITTGRSKGSIGKVKKLLKNKKKEFNRVIVDGVNMVKKHVKPNPNIEESGGIIEIEAPIHISNVALYNPVTKKADRIGFKFLEDGRKVRYFKSNGELVDI